MNFLLNYGISEDTINKIVTNNSNDIILDAEWNMDRVVSSIKYLKEIGIKQINNILINRFDIILRGRRSLERQLLKVNVNDLVDKINNDFDNVYYLDQI